MRCVDRVKCWGRGDAGQLGDGLWRSPQPQNQKYWCKDGGGTETCHELMKGMPASQRLVDEVTLFLHAMDGSAAKAPKAGAQDTDLMGRRVLLVDDDVRNIFALSKALRARGLEVVMQQEATKALAVLEREDAGGIDIVLMDIMMPGMDGYEAMRRIRGNPRHRELPIIALTRPESRSGRLR